ncbi:SPOR domain-containing protein [Alicyclobacillus macrosporangiidus]|uniref:Sporulation related domain-containing protein n=1 Tax=Alicyclobacillus macrosporangiidus TaxID=392015 RepID=A0A1I7JW29_9BACL|nr:hypothetical protein [Alicyclobacillus macrosporangiidus]SFU89390.1 hypothetical protein SAMN05421543_11248 [Alicyclobacillus macrosporangiidus]
MGSPNERGQARRVEEPPLIIRAGGQQWVIRREGSWQQGDAGGAPAPKRAPGRVPVGEGRSRVRWWIGWLAEAVDWLWTDAGEAGSPKADVGVFSRDRARERDPMRTAARRSARGQTARRAQGRRGLRDAFQAGLVFGMGLGCLSMMLFHQLKPDLRGVASAPSANRAVETVTGPAVQLPAVRLYVLQIGSYSTEAAAEEHRQALAKQGVQTVVHSAGTYQLWADASLRQGSLQDELKALEGKGVRGSVVFVGWKAHPIAAPAGASEASVARVNGWLSEAASGLNALVGALSDGGLRQDAITACHTAAGHLPSASDWGETGYGERLAAFSGHLQAAADALSRQQMDKSRTAALQALDDLARMSAGSTSFTISR